MKNWLKEPLLHFFMLGAVIFLVYQFTDAGEESGDDQIVLDDETLNHISALWELQWKRKPTFEELEGLISDYVYQEVLYREALRMNLDHNDEIVKRRLSQKMEFMASDLTKLIAPATDQALQKYLEDNSEKYFSPSKYSFQILTFTSSNHSDPKGFAQNLLQNVDASNLKALVGKGDITQIATAFDEASKQKIDRELGIEFHSSMDELPLNQWVGPVHSGLGEHLLFITEKSEAYLPELSEVRNAVQRDYEYDMEQKSKDAVFGEMKKSYQIVINSESLDKEQKEALSSLLKVSE